MAACLVSGRDAREDPWPIATWPVSAEKNANRGIVSRDKHVLPVPAHIRGQLTHVLAVKLGDFQLHEPVAWYLRIPINL